VTVALAHFTQHRENLTLQQHSQVLHQLQKALSRQANAG
jgi:hypothetical protein